MEGWVPPQYPLGRHIFYACNRAYGSSASASTSTSGSTSTTTTTTSGGASTSGSASTSTSGGARNRVNGSTRAYECRTGTSVGDGRLLAVAGCRVSEDIRKRVRCID